MPSKPSREARRRQAEADAEFQAAQAWERRVLDDAYGEQKRQREEMKILQAEAELEILALSLQRKREILQAQAKAKMSKEEAEARAAEAEIEIQAHMAKLQRERQQAEAKAKREKEEADARAAEAEFELLAAHAKRMRLKAENEASAIKSKQDADAAIAAAEAEILAFAAQKKAERQAAEAKALEEWNKANPNYLPWNENGFCRLHPSIQIRAQHGVWPCRVWTEVNGGKCPQCELESRTSTERRTSAIFDAKGRKVGTKIVTLSSTAPAPVMIADEPLKPDWCACVCLGGYSGCNSMQLCQPDEDRECLALYCCNCNLLPCFCCTVPECCCAVLSAPCKPFAACAPLVNCMKRY